MIYVYVCVTVHGHSTVTDYGNEHAYILKPSPYRPASLTVPIKKGNNRIKVIGYEKADIDIELHIDKGTFKKISF
ncbi:hypothetical protein [Clostridium estertheticum]|nr:hypothetical protein [Clostridium estertheticum]